MENGEWSGQHGKSYNICMELISKLSKNKISSLYRYPIKSCAGEKLERAEIVSTGILHDREFMLVFPNGKFISQRDKGCEKLSLVVPAFISESLIHIDAPGMESIEVKKSSRGKVMQASVWSTTNMEVIDQGDQIAGWFTKYLGGIECRLVAKSETYTRAVSENYRITEHDEVSFADGYPFLMISEESLSDLNSRLPMKLPMNRFRPNIVLSGSGIPYSEDHIRTFDAGGVQFVCVKPCARCVITSTNQEAGMRISDSNDVMFRQPLATLAKYRVLEGGGAVFGQNLIHKNKSGTVSVGDVLDVKTVQKTLRFIVRENFYG